MTPSTTSGSRRVADELAELAGRYRLGLGGAGADEDTAAEIGATFLGGDPVAAADDGDRPPPAVAAGA